MPVTGLVERCTRSGPLPAWPDLSCTPAELCGVLAALLQGDHDGLAAALGDERLPMEALMMLVERQHLLQSLQPAPFALPVKIWSASLLPVSPLHYGLWWLMSLPFRTASSHPSLRSRSLPAGAVR